MSSGEDRGRIDFDTLDRLSRVAREEYGLAGCVQHGASTLPDEAFDHFPEHGTAEVHLATGFQNILYDGGGLPSELRAEMMAWCVDNCAGERKDGETDEQFLYKTRKKAIGPFKERLWNLPADAEEQIGANLRAKFGLLFDELGIGEETGKRYSWGYPACPDLSQHAIVDRLLDGAAIGVNVTDGFQFDPEQTTAALVVSHPDAKYYALARSGGEG